VFSEGRPRLEAQEDASAAFARERVLVELRIGRGDEHVTVLTSDLSADYVAINAHYRT
jgi:N-acetylglutamate synthase/N-acetylornithine aminotransferase